MAKPVSRRAFLRGVLGVGAAACAATLPLTGCAGAKYEAPAGLKLFTPKEWCVLDAAARRLAPAVAGAPGGARTVATHADALFALANPRLKDDLRQLLNTLEDDPWLAGRLTRFTAMADAEKDAYLRVWMTSWLGLQRQAFVGLNRIVAMLYYMDPASWPAIGYPGPWIGRLDVGLGLDNQGPLARNPNPNVFKTFPQRAAAKGA